MAETFLTLMAEYDEETQRIMAAWQSALEAAGFSGTQTPFLPYHISLATFPLDREAEAVALMQRMAAMHAPFPVNIFHLGLFPGGKVLFAAPDRSPELTALQASTGAEEVGGYPWSPHTTLLMGEPDVVASAVPTAVSVFRPLQATVTRLHLCAFWPTREILTVELQG